MPYLDEDLGVEQMNNVLIVRDGRGKEVLALTAWAASSLAADLKVKSEGIINRSRELYRQRLAKEDRTQ